MFFHVPYVFSWFSWCPFNAFPPLDSPGRQQTWPTGKQSKIWQVFPIYFICPKLGSYWDHCGDKFGSWKLILRSTGNWSFCTMITRTTCARLAASGGVKTLLCVSLKSYEAGAYAGGNRKVSVFHGYSGVSLGFHRCPRLSWAAKLLWRPGSARSIWAPQLYRCCNRQTYQNFAMYGVCPQNVVYMVPYLQLRYLKYPEIAIDLHLSNYKPVYLAVCPSICLFPNYVYTSIYTYKITYVYTI